MYSTCLHCTRDLGRNAMIETLPIGRRLAFDADKGRLWVVCGSCGKWNLVPFDTRLESIDACEKLFRDTRTRFSTDNIGMAKVGDGLTLVRVGKALRPEFASWRYGEQYKKRRRVAMGLAGAGGVVVFGAAIGLSSLVGLSMAAFSAAIFNLGKGGYNRVIGHQARVRTVNPGTGERIVLGMWSLRQASISWDHDAPVLRVPRRAGQLVDPYCWEGVDIHSIGRRIAGGLNLTAGSGREISDAVAHLGEHHGDLSRWLVAQQQFHSGDVPDEVVSSPTFAANREAYLREHEEKHRPKVLLSSLPAPQRLAVEMWFSEDIERRWLEGELRLLEREWREAEKLAKIADDLVLEDGS